MAFNKWWTSFTEEKILLCYIDILFGYKVSEPPVLLNYCILNAKFFIYKCKLEETRPILERFLLQIKSDYKIEEHIAKQTKRMTQLNDRWKLLRKWIVAPYKSNNYFRK